MNAQAAWMTRIQHPKKGQPMGLSWLCSRVWFVGLVAVWTLSAVAETVDAVVATVAGQPILRSELLDDIQPAVAALQAQGKSGAELQQAVRNLLRDALNQAVDYQILYREAEFAGVKIEDKEIEERLEKIKKDYPSNEAFLKALEQSGQTLPEFRERLKKQIMAVSFSMSRRKQFEKEATVTEEEMQRYYQEHVKDFERPERVRLRRIFLGAPEDSSQRAQVKARLEALRAELAQGADFAEYAKKFSEGPEAQDGGLVGWVKRGDLVKPLDDEAFALERGQLSDVLETQFGFHLLYVEEKEASGVLPYEKARLEIEPILRAKAAEERYQRWMEDLRRKNKVRILAESL
jgi:parvulin-like peptidyl-prolyl isomerase